MSSFTEIWPTGRRGYIIKRAPTLKSITPTIAERERKKMLGGAWTCWECDRPPPANAWLMIYRMWNQPHARLVCPSCVERVQRHGGMRKRWFAPMESAT